MNRPKTIAHHDGEVPWLVLTALAVLIVSGLSITLALMR